MNIPHMISELSRLGLTQAQIGHEIGVKQTTVSDMKAGRSSITRPSHSVVAGLKRLAAKYSISTEPPKPKSRAQAPSP